ncbi:MAG: glycosyltransferase [Magnetococcus sp. DMHC-6]
MNNIPVQKILGTSLQTKPEIITILNQSMEKILKKNIDVLQETHPELTNKIMPHIGFETYTLRPIFNNNFLNNIEITYSDGQIIHIEDIKQQEIFEKSIAKISETNIHIIIGIHLGIDLQLLFKKTNKTFFPIYAYLNMLVPIYIIDPDISRFLLLLRLMDLTEILRSKRVFFFIGNDYLNDFKYFFSELEARLPNRILNFRTSDISHEIAKLVNDIEQKRQTDLNYYLQENQKFYQLRPLEKWKLLFQGEIGRPLRVMTITSRYTSFAQHVARDLLSGFKQIGCETLYYIEEDHTRIITPSSTVKKIHWFHPDIIFIMNFFRWNQENTIPDQIPFVSWFIDMFPWVFKEDPNCKISDRDFIFSFSPLWIEDRFSGLSMFKEKNIHLLPLGINSDIYYPIKNIKMETDVLYVSHLSDPYNTFAFLYNKEKQFKLLPNEKFLVEKNILSLDDLIEIYRKMSTRMHQLEFSEICMMLLKKQERLQFGTQFFQEHGIATTPEITALFVTTFSRLILELIDLIKATPLIYLAQNGIHLQIYGSNWERFESLRPFAKGPAANGKFLNEITNRSRICINNSGGTTLHMRAVEILGSGVFMLTRRVPKELDTSPILDYFQEGEDLILFDDEKNLLEKIRYYLTHESERQEIARRGQETALRHFGYDRLAQHIIDTIAKEL